ncbi:MAG: phosphoserine phosphatase SerB [Succinivibrio sp.]|nr:phosphoserine phosphatase SerB [Succinivibrio sp.]
MTNYAYIVRQAAEFDLQEAATQLSEIIGLPLKLLGQSKLNDHLGALYACEGGDPLSLNRLCRTAGLPFDAWILPQLPALAQPGILVLDMDMTSVQIEGIDEIARRLGVFEQVSQITHQAMQGGLDFASSLRKRVALLKGGSGQVIPEVKKIMQETGGLEALLQLTLQHGWTRGICSGGFVQLIEVLEQKYQLQLVHANCLGFDEDGRFSGEVVGTIVDAQGKAEAVRELKAQLQVPLSQVIVLGDGANDLKMIEEAGLGIAYHAKPIVVEKAPYALRCSDLSAVALLLTLAEQV